MCPVGLKHAIQAAVMDGMTVLNRVGDLSDKNDNSLTDSFETVGRA